MAAEQGSFMGVKGDSYIIDTVGKDHNRFSYLIEAKSPHGMVDMFFSSPDEAKKYATKHGLIVVDKMEEKFVDGGAIEEDVLTYLQSTYGVGEDQITVGKNSKGKWSILVMDSELKDDVVSKWEKD